MPVISDSLGSYDLVTTLESCKRASADAGASHASTASKWKRLKTSSSLSTGSGLNSRHRSGRGFFGEL